MRSNIVKTCILVVLIVLSLYQTIGLWFDDLSDLNLFYDIVQYSTPTQEVSSSERSYFITPETMAIYLQNEKEYSRIKKTNKEFNDLFSKTIEVLKVILAKGEIIEENIPKERLWDRQSILFKYPIIVNSNQLVKDLDIKNLSFEKHIGSFNEMIVTLTKESDTSYTKESDTSYIYVYFVNDKDYSDIKGMRIIKKDIGTGIDELGDMAEDQKKTSLFISSKNLDIELFDKNVLLPETDFFGADMEYLKKPFYNDGKLNSNQLENYINGFFTNNYKWKIDDEKNEEQWTYSNESVLVNYHTNGIIEYINDNLDNKKDLDVIEAYYLAQRFIDKRDNKVGQEYYLVDYTQEGNKITFNFAYKYDDINIVISEDYLKAYNLKAPMEITVLDGQVQSYRRLLIELDDYMTSKGEYVTNYNEVINKFLKAYPEETTIHDMFLGYILSANGEEMKLNWTIISDNLIYHDEVKQHSDD